jgi:hypothetical protein
MGQVFGETNERQTAAEKLQRLRQTGSVTYYITEFQVITSSLDWDDEALEDKKILRRAKTGNQESPHILSHQTEELGGIVRTDAKD